MRQPDTLEDNEEVGIYPVFRVRPSGFEPETCGLRDRNRGVQGVTDGPLTWCYVSAPSIELGVSRPSIAEIVGRIVGE